MSTCRAVVQSFQNPIWIAITLVLTATGFFAWVHGRYDTIWCYLNWTLVLIFTKKINLTKLSNLKKYLILGVLNLKNSFVPLRPKHLSHNTCPEPSVQFSQKVSHFVHNYKLNPVKLSNFKQYLNLVVWGLKTSF